MGLESPVTAASYLEARCWELVPAHEFPTRPLWRDGASEIPGAPKVRYLVLVEIGWPQVGGLC